MSCSTQESYERLPYPSYTHPRTHPERIFSVAKFLGMQPPSFQTCRVLELGCGDGLGLISFANDLCDAQFTGIDLGERHIAQGNELIEALQLKNVSLHKKDLLEIDESFGEFDYIIAHGVFSWVPEAVGEKVLEICSRNLAPNGVAYVSYNVYPGYRMRQMLREMTLFHSAETGEPEKRIAQGSAFLKFIADAAKPATAFGEIIAAELKDISDKHPADLLYDTLSEFNRPMFFHEFMERAESHQLQYVSEIYYSDNECTSFPANAQALLAQMSGDMIAREQYIDFIRGKRFRMSLLCHKNIILDRKTSPQRIADFLFESLAIPESESPDVKTDKPERFLGVADQEITTDVPMAKAALVLLREALPSFLSAEELQTQICEAIGAKISRAEVCNMLFEFYRAGLVEIHSHQPSFALAASEKPCASALARAQLKTSIAVTALNHINIYITDEFGRKILQLLDGIRDRSALERELSVWIKEHPQLQNKEEVLAKIPNLIETTLAKFAKLALLEA